MDRKIRVGAVSYLNTKPLIYGFENGLMNDQIELLIDYPSRIAQKLIKDEIDLGLVPVAIIPELKQSHIISDYCIACNGAVASVCLFSDVPLSEIKTILLDYQSRTSAELLKILLRGYWNISPALIQAEQGYESAIAGATAGLIIGDRALHERRNFKFIYDLGEAWKQFTGLPFVFAAWISNKPLAADFITQFNAANRLGCDNLEKVVALHPFDDYDLHKYYTTNIIFEPKFDRHDVITLFLNKIKTAQ